MTQYVLGVNAGLHDASAALVRDGELISLVEEERLSRVRHGLGASPADAIQECLDLAAVSPAQLSSIAFGWEAPQGVTAKIVADDALSEWLFPEHKLGGLPHVAWVRHHLAHAACGYFASGASRAAVVVADGSGEDASTTLFLAEGREIVELGSWGIERSIGHFYELAATWAGFGFFGAGKLMGLAAYGRRNPNYGGLWPFEGDFSRPEPPGPRQVPRRDLAGISRSLRRTASASFQDAYPYGRQRNEHPISYADFAANVQSVTEAAMLQIVRAAKALTGADVLVVAGGVAMNCSMIGELVRAKIFEHVYVPPVPTDAGVSLGAAQVVARRTASFEPIPLEHAYWGRDIAGAAVPESLRHVGLTVEVLEDEDLASKTAGLLDQGSIVGWARGRAEIGERALGARSLLADASRRRSLVKLNEIKGREMWRPIAPSVLDRSARRLVDGPLGDPSRFMLQACTMRADCRRDLGAVTHVDGSMRPQVVDSKSNPSFALLLEAVGRRQAYPVVCNTSFNIEGQPIVWSAEDAADTFLKADIDALVLGSALIRKSVEDREVL